MHHCRFLPLQPFDIQQLSFIHCGHVDDGILVAQWIAMHHLPICVSGMNISFISLTKPSGNLSLDEELTVQCRLCGRQKHESRRNFAGLGWPAKWCVLSPAFHLLGLSGVSLDRRVDGAWPGIY